MKRACLLFLAFFILFSSACSARKDQIIESLGVYTTKEFFGDDGFQDYTDFGIYTYKDVNIKNNPYFNKVSENYIEQLLTHIDDFEDWIETIKYDDPECSLVLGYNFDRTIISEQDYFYIEYPAQGSCDVYFFDIETRTLYYFHSNT